MESIFVLCLMSVISALACSKACKIEIRSEQRFNAQGKRIDEQGEPIESPGIFDNLNSLGIGLLLSLGASYIVSWNEIFHKGQPISETVMNAILCAGIEIIFFTIAFYIIYGIMSVFKSNPATRRNTAGWINVGLSFLLTFVYVNQ